MIELDGHWVDYEWGVQYEVDDLSTHIDRAYEKTITKTVSEKLARHAVERGIPREGRNHRVVQRLVSEWREVHDN